MTGDELYAWQVLEPEGNWSMVGALVPEIGTHMPLVHRSPTVAGIFKPLAVEHARRTGQELRLARFTLAEVMESGY